jgi:hypothetical protein
VTTWFSVDKHHVTFSGMKPAAFQSSPNVTRQFCPRCGSPLSYETKNRPGDIDLFVVSLDDHTSFKPAKHEFWSERVPWIELSDDLPRSG